jgi:hypothetical protein
MYVYVIVSESVTDRQTKKKAKRRELQKVS